MIIDKPIEYEQTDKRWASVPYTITGDKTQTIGTSGCGPTCAAMVIATLRNEKFTPVEACSYALSKGYRTKNSGTSWAFFRALFDAYRIPFAQTGSAADALSALDENRMVISCASKGIWTSSGHFILAYGAKSGKVYINDPNSEKAYRECADENLYWKQMVQFWIIKEGFVMSEEKVKEIIRAELSGRGSKPSTSLADEWEAAKAAGITDGGRPLGYATREQVAAMVLRATQ